MRNTRKFQIAGWVVAACLSGIIGSPAQAKSTLTCTILDETGKPLGKEQIILVAPNGKEKKEKTNEDGLVQFKGLDDGTYRIYGAIQGYVASKSAPMELSGNAEKTCNYTIPSANYASTLLQDVLQLVKQKKFEEAEQKGQKAVEVLPGEGGSHYVLAISHASLGKEAEALKHIQMAAELDPTKYKEVVTPVQLMALDTQANQDLAKGNFDGAMQKYDAMKKVAPNDPTVYYNIAVALGRQSKFDEALKEIDKAIEMKPQDTEFQQTKLRLQDMYLKSMDRKLEAK
ncbi:MAG: tetratricopeptide repeat protein [Acidobacteria bacterium]|nr:tetratricopeptide repeat protein [Acidobacteriota bacterium]